MRDALNIDLTPPRRLAALMGTEEWNAAGRVFADAASLLRLSGTPFFPDYTDHGIAHIQSILSSIEQLISDAVWEAEALSGRDALVICLAVVLHDIGMHIQEPGFLELVAPECPFGPLPWTSRDEANSPWHTLWDEYKKEARHFSSTQLERLLGAQHQGVPSLAYGSHEEEPAEWTRADRLLVGEFLRRHHARIAHEVAVCGFPGGRHLFPRLQDDPETADIVGVIARSHGVPIRDAFQYLETAYDRNLLPAGVHAHYLMALIRIADFLQLDATRAPSLLLKLKEPVSRTTLEEWRKTGAVARVSPKHRDEAAFYVEVKPDHGLHTHFALRDILNTFQAELDTTGAALREAYGGQERLLRIAQLRVVSNLDNPRMTAQLPYVPVPARLHSSHDLFRLIVSDLYGNEPAVAGRELLQNAVDAVRQRDSRESPGTRSQDITPISVRVSELNAEMVELEVSDLGIGMSVDVVTNYFLSAGASSAVSHERDTAKRAAVRAGRFGIGAFAAFVLSSEMEVVTRSIDSEHGLSFTVSLADDLVEISRCDAPVGTRVTVRFARDVLSASGAGWDSIAEFAYEISRYYVLDAPSLTLNVLTQSTHTEDIRAEGFVPTSETGENDRWRRFTWRGLEAIQWSWDHQMVRAHRAGAAVSNFAHNGFEIRPPRTHPGQGEFGYRWKWGPVTAIAREPYVAVTDREHQLGLTLTRYTLADRYLPFESRLARSIGEDVVARGLARGAGKHPAGRGEALSPVVIGDGWFPLTPRLLAAYVKAGELVWILTTSSDELTKSFFASGDFVPDEHRLIRVVAGGLREIGHDRVMMTWTSAWHEVGRAELQPHFRQSGFSGEAKVEDVRVSWGEEWVADIWRDWLACKLGELVKQGTSFLVRAFERRADGDWCDEVREPISEVWEEIVGGRMPQAGAQRSVLGRQLAANWPDLKKYLERWEPSQDMPE